LGSDADADSGASDTLRIDRSLEAKPSLARPELIESLSRSDQSSCLRVSKVGKGGLPRSGGSLLKADDIQR